MSVREVGTAEFNQLASRTQGKLVVAQFTATWCGPCRRISPQFDALARRTPDVEFVKVYEHNSRDAMIAVGVRSLPTFHFYCGGAKVDECQGANIQAVEQKVVQHKDSASAAAGPVTIKLRFDRERLRESGNGTILITEEEELEVHASEGLEIFRFQVLSITDIETDDQVLTTGDSNASVESDAGLVDALRRTGGGVYGNYPVIRVVKRAAGTHANPGQAGATSSSVEVGANARGMGQGVEETTPKWDECCSRTFFGKDPAIQPAHVIREESLLPQSDLTDLQKQGKGPESILVVCKTCAENCFVLGRAEPSPAISVSAAFVCQSKEACAKGYGADLFSERADTGEEVLSPGFSLRTAVEAAATSAAERVWHPIKGAPAGEDGDTIAMRRKIEAGIKGALEYENMDLQAKALAVLPAEDGHGGGVRERGREMAATGGFSEEEGRARSLLSWFKKDFFTWTSKPPCSACGARGPKIENEGSASPTPAENAAGASRVELYRCKDCSVQTRFPRYIDPAKLLETRTGRCGEWANCFTLMCRAVGLEARRVLDWTDHVWTEIWIPSKKRWVHADCCENKLDKPLMYEAGWNKRLSYVVAFDRDGAVDVTRRYTRQWLQVLSRRALVPEKYLAELLASASARRPAARTTAIAVRLAEEQEQLKTHETMFYDGDRGLDNEEKEGRQSGDSDWVASRGEGGDGVSISPGPKRLTTQTISCPMIGAPLGVIHSDGGLSLSLAAVLADGGKAGASVLIGASVVSKAQGRRVLCAAAVASSTGVLLDARVFTLEAGRENDSSSSTAVTAWLTDQPDGTVIAMSASHWAEGGDIDSNLETALSAIVADDVSERAAAERGSWALLGWKGSSKQKWTRRQYKSIAGGDKRGSRCALHAELLVPPLPASTSTADNPVDKHGLIAIEMRDRLCATPLCSTQEASAVMAAPRAAPADEKAPSLRDSMKAQSRVDVAMQQETRFPVRGVCSHEGEADVLVGPNVDLIECKGWTTVLKGHAEGGPRESGKGAGLDAVDVGAWRITEVSAARGGWHDDTEKFDDAAFGCPASVMGGSPAGVSSETPFLPVGRVKEIVGWSGDNLNGVQVLYDVGGVTVRAPKHLGEHGLYRQSSLVLDLKGGERIEDITVQARGIVDSLTIRTNKGREKKWGGDGSDTSHTWHLTSNQAFLGFIGGVGGHIHSLGVTLAEQDMPTRESSPRIDGLEPSKTAADAGTTDSTTVTDQSLLSSTLTINLYSTDPVRRAYAEMLAYNATTTDDHSMSAENQGNDGDTDAAGVNKEAENRIPLIASSEEMVTALETARKYADNLLKSPLDPRVSRIRLGNGFFDRKIGRLPGAGGLMRALGFMLHADEEGRMQYVFRRADGDGVGGLGDLRHACVTLTELIAASTPSTVV